jgi:hypothetical protein
MSETEFSDPRVAELAERTGEAPKPFFEVVDHDTLIEAVRARIREIGITYETLDAMGFARGHVGKIMAPRRTRNTRGIGRLTFGLLLQFTGMKLIAVEDPETTEKYRPHWKKRVQALPQSQRRRPRMSRLVRCRSRR